MALTDLRHLADGRCAATYERLPDPDPRRRGPQAGIGKSRLLQAALDRARELDLRIVSARGEELERTRPFGVVAEALGCRESSADPELAARLGADWRPRYAAGGLT